MEFVDSRSKILEKEVEKIELQKQKFKQNNRLSDIKVDAEFNAQQQYNYDGELFRSQSQKRFINSSRTNNFGESIQTYAN